MPLEIDQAMPDSQAAEGQSGAFAAATGPIGLSIARRASDVDASVIIPLIVSAASELSSAVAAQFEKSFQTDCCRCPAFRR